MIDDSVLTIAMQNTEFKYDISITLFGQLKIRKKLIKSWLRMLGWVLNVKEISF